jgi:hypothetical protein
MLGRRPYAIPRVNAVFAEPECCKWGAPPELPLLTAASFWMKSSYRIVANVAAAGRHDTRCHRPAETEGLPTASTQSPMRGV